MVLLFIAAAIFITLLNVGAGILPALFLTATLVFWLGWDWFRARNWL